MNRGFKGIWIPAEIWLIKDLKTTVRVFLAEIDSLDNEAGCFADNQHFSELFGLSKNRCSEIINSLEKDGYITISYAKIKSENKRILRVKTPSVSRQTPSVSRQTPSVSRQTPSVSRQTPSVSRQLYNKYINTITNTEREKGNLASNFLKTSFPSQWETFEMQNKKLLKDWDKMLLDFNDTVEIERLDFDGAILFARIRKYTRNYISNDNKFNKPSLVADQSVEQLIGQNISYAE